MANTLLDNVKKLRRGPDGTLTEETPEELQTLAKKAGLSAPPISAVGAGALGANPDQQKMAGTPAQKSSAISIAQQGSNDLATNQRLQQSRSQATAGESSEIEKARKLQQLADIGPRAQSLIDAEISKLAQSQPQTVPQVSQQAISQQNPNSDPLAAKSALEAFLANPNDINAAVQVNVALGRTPNSPLTSQEASKYLGDLTTQTAQTTASALTDKVSIGQLTALPEFGYSTASLSQLLGVPEQELGNYSIQQLHDKINEQITNENSSVANLQALATDPNVGAAEREAARGQLREASATGVRSAESSMTDLSDAIAAGDQVSFGGKVYSTEDLLKDENISNIVKEYLNSAPDSETRKNLEQTEPGLVDFVNKHQDALGSVVKQAGDTLNRLGSIQSDNQKLLQDLGVDESIVKEILPEGKFATEALDPASNGLLGFLNELPKGAKRDQAAAQIAGMVRQYPEMANEFAKMSAGDLTKLQLNSPNGSKLLQDYVEVRKFWDNVNNIDPKDTDSVLQAFFQNESHPNTEQIGQSLQEAKKNKLLGLSYDKSLARLDSNSDGKLDSSAEILQNLKSYVGHRPGTLSEAISGTKKPHMYSNAPTYKPIQPMEGIDRIIHDKLQDAVADDILTTSEVDKAGFSLEEATKILSSKSKDLPEPIKVGLQKIVDADKKVKAVAEKKAKDAAAAEKKAAAPKQELQDLIAKDHKDMKDVKDIHNLRVTTADDPVAAARQRIISQHGKAIADIVEKATKERPGSFPTIYVNNSMGMQTPVAIVPSTGESVEGPPADAARKLYGNILPNDPQYSQKKRMDYNGLTWEYNPQTKNWSTL